MPDIPNIELPTRFETGRYAHTNPYIKVQHKYPVSFEQSRPSTWTSLFTATQIYKLSRTQVIVT